MKHLPILIAAVLVLSLHALPARAVHSVYIVNASFESPTNVNASIGFTNIMGWARSNNRSGLNPTASGWGAYADTGKRPDKRQVAFLNTEDGTLDISQTLTGLDTTKQYNLQFWHNARYWTNEINTNVCYFGVFFGEQVLAQITNTALDNWSDPYYFTNLVFTPATSAGSLYFRNYQIATNVFSTLALDAICLFYLDDPSTLVVKNPSFEASGEQGPGGSGTGIINKSPDWMTTYWDFIAGWEYWDGGYNSAAFGVGTNSNPYFGSELVPEGQNAFFDNKAEEWYFNSGHQTMLKQTIEGLTPTELYNLSYYYNARPGVNDMFSPSNFTVTIGGLEVQRQDFLPWSSPFYFTTVTFMANWTYMDLVFGTSNSASGSTTLLDDVEIWPVPEPVLLLPLLLLCSLRLKG